MYRQKLGASPQLALHSTCQRLQRLLADHVHRGQRGAQEGKTECAGRAWDHPKMPALLEIIASLRRASAKASGLSGLAGPILIVADARALFAVSAALGEAAIVHRVLQGSAAASKQELKLKVQGLIAEAAAAGPSGASARPCLVSPFEILPTLTDVLGTLSHVILFQNPPLVPPQTEPGQPSWEAALALARETCVLSVGLGLDVRSGDSELQARDPAAPTVPPSRPPPPTFAQHPVPEANARHALPTPGSGPGPGPAARTPVWPAAATEGPGPPRPFASSDSDSRAVRDQGAFARQPPGHTVDAPGPAPNSDVDSGAAERSRGIAAIGGSGDNHRTQAQAQRLEAESEEEPVPDRWGGNVNVNAARATAPGPSSFPFGLVAPVSAPAASNVNAAQHAQNMNAPALIFLNTLGGGPLAERPVALRALLELDSDSLRVLERDRLGLGAPSTPGAVNSSMHMVTGQAASDSDFAAAAVADVYITFESAVIYHCGPLPSAPGRPQSHQVELWLHDLTSRRLRALLGESGPLRHVSVVIELPMELPITDGLRQQIAARVLEATRAQLGGPHAPNPLGLTCHVTAVEGESGRVLVEQVQRMLADRGRFGAPLRAGATPRDPIDVPSLEESVLLELGLAPPSGPYARPNSNPELAFLAAPPIASVLASFAAVPPSAGPRGPAASRSEAAAALLRLAAAPRGALRARLPPGFPPAALHRWEQAAGSGALAHALLRVQRQAEEATAAAAKFAAAGLRVIPTPPPVKPGLGLSHDQGHPTAEQPMLTKADAPPSRIHGSAPPIPSAQEDMEASEGPEFRSPLASKRIPVFASFAGGAHGGTSGTAAGRTAHTHYDPDSGPDAPDSAAETEAQTHPYAHMHGTAADRGVQFGPGLDRGQDAFPGGPGPLSSAPFPGLQWNQLPSSRGGAGSAAAGRAVEDFELETGAEGDWNLGGAAGDASPGRVRVRPGASSMRSGPGQVQGSGFNGSTAQRFATLTGPAAQAPVGRGRAPAVPSFAQFTRQSSRPIAAGSHGAAAKPPDPSPFRTVAGRFGGGAGLGLGDDSDSQYLDAYDLGLGLGLTGPSGRDRRDRTQFSAPQARPEGTFLAAAAPADLFPSDWRGPVHTHTHGRPGAQADADDPFGIRDFDVAPRPGPRQGPRWPSAPPPRSESDRDRELFGPVGLGLGRDKGESEPDAYHDHRAPASGARHRSPLPPVARPLPRRPSGGRPAPQWDEYDLGPGSSMDQDVGLGLTAKDGHVGGGGGLIEGHAHTAYGRGTSASESLIEGWVAAKPPLRSGGKGGWGGKGRSKPSEHFIFGSGRNSKGSGAKKHVR